MMVCFMAVVLGMGCWNEPKPQVEPSVNSVLLATSEADDSDEYVFPDYDGSNMGHILYERYITNEQKRFLAKLQKIGVEASFDDNEAAGTAGVTGFGCNYLTTPKVNARPDRMDRPFERNLVKRIPFDDALLEETVKLFPDIAALGLVNSHVTDEGLEILAKYSLPHLWSLSIGNTDPDYADPMAITDKGMKAIGQLRQLTNIKILGCSITDEGVAHIENSQWIELPGNKLTAKAFRSFAKMKSLRNLFLSYNDFSDPIDKETYEAIVSLNGKLRNLAFSNSDNVHPSFIRATGEIKSLMGYSWDMTGNTPIWKFHAGPDLEGTIPYTEISYDAILDALRRRHPDMDLTEWEKWREIEFGQNGEVLPRAN